MEGDISRWFRETIGVSLRNEAMMLSSGDFEEDF